MNYTAFSIQHLKPGTSRRAVAAVVHAFSGCGRCEDKGCKCCAGGACKDDCQCHSGKTCGTCRFQQGGKSFRWILAEMMQIDAYSQEQFTFEGLRCLADQLRGFSETNHITMTHVNRDWLTEEVP